MPIGFSRSQILLHWLIVLLVGVEWFTFGRVAAFFRGEVIGDGSYVPLLHALSGAGILVATVASMILARLQGREAPDETIPPIVRTLEWLVRLSLYLTLLALPASGAWVAFIDADATGLHRRISGLLLFLVLTHLVLIAWHLMRRDNVLQRMVRPEAPPAMPPTTPRAENAIAEPEPKSE